MGESEGSEEDELADPLYVVEEVRGIHGYYKPPIKVLVNLDHDDVCMELDSVSIMSLTQYNKQWPVRSLGTTKIVLKTYSKGILSCKGQSKYQGVL